MSFKFTKSQTNKKNIPNFLIDKDIEVDDLQILLDGLRLSWRLLR